MYPLGVMFGLGFDTSSEVALLGIASIQGSKGTSIWLILIFPVLFTGEWSSILVAWFRLLLFIFGGTISEHPHGYQHRDRRGYLKTCTRGFRKDPHIYLKICHKTPFFAQ